MPKTRSLKTLEPRYNPPSRRSFSSLPPFETMSSAMSKSDSKAIAARNKARFLAVFPSIVDELVESLKVEGMPSEVTDWYKTVSSVISDGQFDGEH